MLSNECWEGSLPGLLLLWELAGYQSADGEQLGFFASPVFLGFVFICLIFIFFITLSLPQPKSSLAFVLPILSAIPVEEVSKWLCSV